MILSPGSTTGWLYEKLAMPLFHQCMQEKRPVGIMFVDADHLKYINDTFGHDMGNLAISSIASVLRQHCPAESVSIRYGGDEFVCVIPDYDKQKNTGAGSYPSEFSGSVFCQQSGGLPH